MHGSHLVNHIKNPGLRTNNTLHVIGVIQNSVRYQSRYRLFHQWVKEMLATPNVELHVVEAVYGDRLPECAPQNGEYNYHQVRTKSEIWLKENMINIAVRNLLPSDWRYMAWVDCDISFSKPNWALETIHQLQHYNIVQPWSHAVDLDAVGGVCGSYSGFGYLCANRKKMWHGKGKDGYTYAHTGFAWACNRYFYENVEKLVEFCIIGSGDHHMAWACLGKIEETIHQKVSKEYLDTCQEWERKAKRASAGIVGYVDGMIRHFHHGPKQRRGYWSRWNIVIDNHFNPKLDICHDSQGVVTLCGDNRYHIEHSVMGYNRERMEDSIEQY